VAVAVSASIVVGRDGELKTLAAFVAAEEPRALLLEGEAGVGKTTLWYEGLRAAAAAGHHVLTCAPALTESQLSFAGIADLLDGLLDDALPGLSVPQRHALEVALLREEADGPPPDERAIAAAFLGVLHRLGDTGPVLLAVDDAQWLDPPSRSVLEFVVRRLGNEPVALLVSRRGSGDGEAPLHLDRALGPQRVQRIVVAPLSLGAFHRLLQERLGASFPRPVLRRLHENAGGNPFYGLELARALSRRDGPVDRDDPLPVPVGLQELVAARLQTLSPAARRLLEIVSALLDRRTTVVADLARDEGIEGAIDEAVAVGVLEERGRRLAFTHPLLASGV
jgi:hypothetical protein